MYSVVRPLLFSMDAERAHSFSLAALHYLPQICFKPISTNTVHSMGLQFPHAVGLAAGLDKNGEHLDALAKLGFAFIELGTVTPKPQVGNPKPRLFRIPQAQAIINRMGFNNQGVDALIAHVQRARYQGVLGINIGKNKDTPLDKAVEDYRYCLQKVYPYASYITINISSPNTPDLRQLQQREYFSNLLKQLVAEQNQLAQRHQHDVPLVVKISPDEDPETLKQMTDVILTQGIAGIIATNTTCSREGVNHLRHGDESGGLSGRPVHELSLQCLRLLKRYVGDAVTLIGVGGIDSCESAQAKLEAGASLIQIYSGLIYQGPQLVRDLAVGLNRK
ncbi:MAG: quinone-dependent dihydroorotate dehydrogenase [Legionella sp.]|uniref:quinone-dependent dihydroorotate dehydrogenase n=1 Tax=Legionella sp. TaxID=459 RepID=UPI0039E5A1D0